MRGFQHKWQSGKAMTGLADSQGTPGAAGGNPICPPIGANQGPYVVANVPGAKGLTAIGLCRPGLVARFRSGRPSSNLVVETYSSRKPSGTLATYNKSDTIGPSSRGAVLGDQAPGTRLQKVLDQGIILWRFLSRIVTSASIISLVTRPLPVLHVEMQTTGTLGPTAPPKGPRSTLRSAWNMVILVHPVSWIKSNSANHAIPGRRIAKVN